MVRDTRPPQSGAAIRFATDLVLGPTLDHSRFLLGSLALGYLRNFAPLAGFVIGLGARGALGLGPSDLEPFYGSSVMGGGMVFVRVAVAPMSHGGH